jgi:alpha-mannosidase
MTLPLKNRLDRRSFVKTGLLFGAGVICHNLPESLRAQTTGGADSFCVALCNHWSYIGIGWQLGIESCVLSAIDAMGMADLAPHVKTCIEWDARAYEFMAEKFPEIANRLKPYLAAGKIELIGGTYGQPLGTMFSGESNIRQIVYGRNTILKALDYEMVTFLDEEEFSHPQIPQIVLGAGYRYASLSQVDTWGKAGVPHLEVNSFEWQGMDGSKVPTTPRNGLFGYSPDIKTLAASKEFKALRAQGKPLIFTWEEFGWDHPESPAYLETSKKYAKVAEDSAVEFVTLKEYLDKYGPAPNQAVYFDMDAWRKLLTWGLGGDQLRVMDRKVEAKLLAAERFGAIAFTLGAANQAEAMESAWKHLLTSQSHDVALCEYSRWQGDRMAPLDRIEDYHNLTWGSIGYGHLDAANQQGGDVLNSSLRHIAGHIHSEEKKQGPLAVTVFNPCAWERTDIATTGRIYPIPERIKDIVVKHHSGRVVLSQIMESHKNGDGDLLVAEVSFLAEKVPSLGYDTYYLVFEADAAKAPNTDLHIDEAQSALENRHLKIRLDQERGAIIGLFDKATGQEMLRSGTGAFPFFKGTPNQDYSLYNDKPGAPWQHEIHIPKSYDSSTSKATYTWVDKGPLRATLKARHEWPRLTFETWISLYANLPWVEVTTRVLAEIPPAVDVFDQKDHFPVEIKEGYWLTFAPNFPATSVIRDFPLGIEATKQPVFQGRTFVDLVGNDCGLLVLHPGTQYFKRDGDGTYSNLIMREWESFYSHEYGWPRYSEYRHLLRPHEKSFSNADRARAADEFSQKLVTVVEQPQSGTLPAVKSFIEVKPESAHLLVFRKKESQGFELRTLEVAGAGGEASVQFEMPVSGASETNLLGTKTAGLSPSGKTVKFELHPWKVTTCEIV